MTPISELDLAAQIRNVVKNLNIGTAEQLAELSEVDLLRTPNCGRKSIDRLKSELAKVGLSLAEYEAPERPYKPSKTAQVVHWLMVRDGVEVGVGRWAALTDAERARYLIDAKALIRLIRSPTSA